MEIPESKVEVSFMNGVRSLMISVFFALLSFFILLNSISATNNDKAREIMASLQDQFKDKDIKQELTLFEQIKPPPASATFSKSFRVLLTEFLDSQKATADTVLSETPALYIVKVNMLSFFGPENNNARPNAGTFLNGLNRYIEENKKRPYSRVKLVMLYNKNNYTGLRTRLMNLEKSLDAKGPDNISLSLMDSDSIRAESFKNIYLIFDKNEF